MSTITGVGVILFFVVVFVVIMFIAHGDYDQGDWEL